jgi:hypothetical protein
MDASAEVVASSRRDRVCARLSLLRLHTRVCQRGGRVGYFVGTCCVADGSMRRTPPFWS